MALLAVLFGALSLLGSGLAIWWALRAVGRPSTDHAHLAARPPRAPVGESSPTTPLPPEWWIGHDPTLRVDEDGWPPSADARLTDEQREQQRRVAAEADRLGGV